MEKKKDIAEITEEVFGLTSKGKGEVATHPVQSVNVQQSCRLPQAVTLRAYEVYCHIHGKQDKMVTGWCRGGFHISEIISFLYARSFPKEEWEIRARESDTGMENI